MLLVQDVKNFLRLDADDEEDTLIASLIVTAKTLVEQVLRSKIANDETLPEPIKQAMLIVIGTLYEERQITKDKSGVEIKETLDLVRRMLFAYREEAF